MLLMSRYLRNVVNDLGTYYEGFTKKEYVLSYVLQWNDQA